MLGVGVVMSRAAAAGLAAVLASAGWPALALAESSPAGGPEPGGEGATGRITAFTDLQPEDWAYQALVNLLQLHRCGAAGNGAPPTWIGQRSLSRFEAAALLQGCLSSITAPTDAVRGLLQDLAPELELLRSRQITLEKQLDLLAAQVFSPTTRLSIESFWVAGGNSYSGNAINSGANTFSVANELGPGDRSVPLRNALSFNYDIRLNFSTSWTGDDLLYTRLRAGNFTGSGFDGFGSINMATLDAAYGIGPLIRIDRLYYKWPVGRSLSLMVGPRLRNTEVLGFRPQAYDGILDFFTLAGAPAVYNKATGAGFGFSWKQPVAKGRPYLVGGFSYVAERGQSGFPGLGGILNSNSGNNVNLQLGGRGSNWAVAAGYRYGTCFSYSRRGTNLVMGLDDNGLYCNRLVPGNNASSHSLGVGGYWQPLRHGWIPAFSLGWGYSRWLQSGAIDLNNNTVISATQSWAVALQWNDALVVGNAAGLAVGQGTMATELRTGTTPNDGNLALEGWYRFQLTDAISITPAIFYLANPLGQTLASRGQQLNNLGVLLQTRFQF
jgi:hypothetical protein